jgi:hypothetical protein
MPPPDPDDVGTGEEIGTTGGGDEVCESHYRDLARAANRQGLDAQLMADVDPAVARLRVQGAGPASGYEHQPAEVVDLLTASGRRVMQIEVFELADGQWYAGQWEQCID